MQSLNSVQDEGEEYLLVESKPGLGFHPEQFGIVTEQLHTACLRGFVCAFAIRDGGFFLDSLEVLAKDGRYPEINGVSPACRGGPCGPRFISVSDGCPTPARSVSAMIGIGPATSIFSGLRLGCRVHAPPHGLQGNPPPHHEAQLPRAKTALPSSQLGNDITWIAFRLPAALHESERSPAHHDPPGPTASREVQQ